MMNNNTVSVAYVYFMILQQPAGSWTVEERASDVGRPGFLVFDYRSRSANWNGCCYTHYVWIRGLAPLNGICVSRNHYNAVTFLKEIIERFLPLLLTYKHTFFRI